ncbi:hypothetical protein O1L68_19320 [Streptomyces lydicus]|nr:hypothetical protein [Streptomyces lydicus]
MRRWRGRWERSRVRRAAGAAGGARRAAARPRTPLPPWLWPAPLITAGITVAVAHIAAVLACARTAKVRPAEALREARPGTARKVTGLVLLFVGVSSAGTAVLQRGAAAVPLPGRRR